MTNIRIQLEYTHTWGTDCRSGSHLREPTRGELGNAIESALQDGHNVVYIHNTCTRLKKLLQDCEQLGYRAKTVDGGAVILIFSESRV